MALEMRGLDEVRALLGSAAAGKTDEEILELRDRAYQFAETLRDFFVARRMEGVAPGYAARQRETSARLFPRRIRGRRNA